jgi:glutaminyl-peptide cyclotransferase
MRRSRLLIPRVLVVPGVRALLLPLGFGRTSSAAPVFGYQIVAAWPHDPTAYTEGLAFDHGVLYESTGLNGQSTLRTVSLRTGRPLRRVLLAKRYYAEGVTVRAGRAYQLTLLDRMGFVYDAQTLRRQSTFGYDGEGWGLAHDGKFLVISDGTNVLRFLDPATFAVRRKLVVRDGSASVTSLNELEGVDGAICANVFPTNRIACVDTASGRVRYWVDLSGLLPKALQPSDEEAVPNGIAYGGHPGRLFVTGKYWPRLFEIRLVKKS